MTKFEPLPRLADGQPFTAIQEESRVAALGGRFLAWKGCFHYLIPVTAFDGVLREQARPSPFVIYSCLYEPWSHELLCSKVVPVEGFFGWESRAKEISNLLHTQDLGARLSP